MPSLPNGDRDDFLSRIDNAASVLGDIQRIKKSCAKDIDTIRSFSHECIVNYHKQFEKEVMTLVNAGINLESMQPSKFVVNGYKHVSIGLNSYEIWNVLGFKIPLNPQIAIEHYFTKNPKTREPFERTNSEIERVTKLAKVAKMMATDVANSYGSVNYLLTQFPELKVIFSGKIDPIWKPNPSYKVRPRSSFPDPNCMVEFLGECAISGIKV